MVHTTTDLEHHDFCSVISGIIKTYAFIYFMY